MESKIDFIKSSITDVQSTIRAIDAKIIALLFMTIIPITQIKVIYFSFSMIEQKTSFWSILILIILIVSWASSLTFSFLTLLGVKNPRQNIPNNGNFKGIYFGDNLFVLKFKKLFNTKELTPNIDISVYIGQFEMGKDKLFKELVYEQMKLIYIRDIKFLRHKAAFISLYVLIIVTAIVLIMGQILVSHG